MSFSLSNQVRVLEIEQEQRSPREYKFSMAECRLGVMTVVCECTKSGNTKKGEELLKLMLSQEEIRWTW